MLLLMTLDLVVTLNSIQAGEAYYVGNSLEYIDGEKTETLDAWNYVGEMATAAMRNFDVLAYNCSTTLVLQSLMSMILVVLSLV